jgi:hypothetical protein
LQVEEMRIFAKKKTKGDNIVGEPIGNILETHWKQFLKIQHHPTLSKRKIRVLAAW